MNILLLQGPLSPFFAWMSRDLRLAGHTTLRVLFNGGDELWAGDGPSLPYRGTPEQWPDFLRNLYKTHHIDTVVLYGDCRFYHVQAIQIAKELGGILPLVFEEGYLRPDYITLEPWGVNANSRLQMQDAAAQQSVAPKEIHHIGPTRLKTPFAIAAYVAQHLFANRYPHYRHHRPYSPIRDGFYWIRAFVRKAIFRWRERGIKKRLTAPDAAPYFLAILQVHCDSQVRVHSRYRSITQFIGETIAAFVHGAAPDAKLVFKHHPMDRGHAEYTEKIRTLAKHFGVADRVIAIHDQRLPPLLRTCKGVITINSSVGLSALIHGRPLATMAPAVYRRNHLRHHAELKNFFHNPQVTPLEPSCIQFLRAFSQVNGTYYQPCPWLHWKTILFTIHTVFPVNISCCILPKETSSSPIKKTPMHQSVPMNVRRHRHNQDLITPMHAKI